ncbi:Lrp/AsnC family transcriptional regulator [Arthrobacter sp. NIO-1057]|uniref:Lrp/AsnC family transcriptional regulator n=1 Tax=Arthrobacter sp. NIO-1057 TaxID=993071 RepID=UPI00071C5CC5|nr:Lrp/AsnC family transcriptional regulator [Arthrobacter sp. NIO-1057]KSU68052.1 AsnC family transcriptional regulator [Arthrobacter sp. NIO-1057]SCB87113.1 DNA-binding transcriptional regulator, Lrp family [Arthrobacter sp. NIO-1057]
MRIDRLDADLIELLTDSPMLPVMECARRLGVARGTVSSRLARLHEAGVIRGIIPRIEPAGFGYTLVAFCQVEIIQRDGHVRVSSALEDTIPEIVDMYTVTGSSDLQLRVVARTANDLQDIFDRINRVPGVARTSSSFALHEHFQGRTLPLVNACANSAASLDKTVQND